MTNSRFAFRLLSRNVSFAIIAILTLALGIGANTAIFSVLNTILLRPLPYPNPEKLVTLWQSNSQSGDQHEDVSAPNMLDWKERSKSFTGITSMQPYGFDMVGEGRPETLPTALITEGFFETLGVKALHGRTLSAEDYRPGAPPVLMIEYGPWKDRFGGDPGIVGKALRCDNKLYTVVGILPPQFSLTGRVFGYGERTFWAANPLEDGHQKMRGAQLLRVVARLRDDVTMEQAAAEMSTIAANLRTEHPDTNREMGVTITPLRETAVGGVKKLLWLLAGAAALVLLIAAANIANLLLARGSARARELAIRSSLGASRWQIVRQLLIEGLVLAICGGILGTLLSIWLTRGIVHLAPETMHRIGEATVDIEVVIFTLVITVLAALIFSIFPALHFSRKGAGSPIQSGEARHTEARSVRAFRGTLVAAEIALALVLLTGAGLLMRSFQAILSIDPGFKPDNLMLVQLFIWDRYNTPEQRIAFFHEATEKIAAVPGVTAVGASSAVPFADVAIDIETTFLIGGRPAPRVDEEPLGFITAADERYFQTMGIPLLRGRNFATTDSLKSGGVVIITESLARKYWGSADPIGSTITLRMGKPSPREIIGVVGDSRYTSLDESARPVVFVPIGQSGTGSMTLLVRTSGDPAVMVKPVQETIWKMNSTLPIYSTDLMEDLVNESLRQRRFVLMLFGGFSILALLLAAIGIYGVISYTTSQRTREIGIRSALGADRPDVLRLVLSHGIFLAMAGIVAGVFGALILSRFLQGMLFGIGQVDPITFASTSLLLLLTAFAATWFPAYRAARINPVEALRQQ